MVFSCIPGCSRCCSIAPGEEKKILVFPEEAASLERIAAGRDVALPGIIEEMVFPDIKRRLVLVGSYRMRFDEKGDCGFLDKEKRQCSVHLAKPLACKAYPLAIKRVDATRSEYFIDTGCEFVSGSLWMEETLAGMNSVLVVEAFLEKHLPAELQAAKALEKRLSWIHLRLRQVEATGEGRIGGPEYTLHLWDEALAHWGREDLVPERGEGED